MELYPERNTRGLDQKLFRNPGPAYRAAPFWAWNNTLSEPQLLRQLEVFASMGFGGAHIHCRVGLGTPYLGPEFLRLVRSCAKRSKKLGLLTWLYDEDRWPSGAAGGLVTRNKRFRMKQLLLTPTPYARKPAKSAVGNHSRSRSGRRENGKLLAVYGVVLDAAGNLVSYRRLGPKGEPSRSRAGERRWYAYEVTTEPNAWFNNQTYVDTLNPRAIERFIEVTHERYRKLLGPMFGKEVPAIFTDEPQFARKSTLEHPKQLRDLTLPWTADLPASYRKTYSADFLATLPEVIWQLPGSAPSVARYRFHEHVAERFAAAFADTLGQWCQRHGLGLTGHMMDEQSLGSQTHSLGEAMRSYRSFDIPGIDILCDAFEFTTAKQAQSASRQFGRPGMTSELYGVVGWHFDFVGHKRQGDWQAALGVTVRVPHLAMVSMAGEAKRDYPASIGEQSPWYREYKTIEDHFARVNTAMTRGKAVVRVGVIHPIESYWLCYGPASQTAGEREQRETQFQSIHEWLLLGGIDFDLVAESLLPGLSSGSKDGSLRVGAMAYDVVVVPGMRTIRATTLALLEAFAASGGTVVFAGEVPTLVDAVPSGRPAALAGRCVRIPFEKVSLLAALDPFREVRIDAGVAGDWTAVYTAGASILHQLRDDGPMRYLFLCNTDRGRGRPDARVAIRGDWTPTLLDTFTAKRTPLAADYRGGWTHFSWNAPAAGSLLLQLAPGRVKSGLVTVTPRWQELARVDGPAGGVPVTLAEPNVLVLDQPQWRVGRGPWQGADEILHVDDLARERLGLPRRLDAMAQPWTDARPDPVVGTLELRYQITSDVAVAQPRLALEDAAATTIRLDGRVVSSQPGGWWVDEAITTVALPALQPGQHELLLRIPMTRKRNVEACYLLGDFGVRVHGQAARLIPKVTHLHWGDWTTQGLPFYGGNVTYHCSLPGLPSGTALEVPHFAAPVIAVDVETRRLGTLAFPPFRVALPGRARSINLTAFGNRANTFGPLHLADKFLRWMGPGAWRTRGDRFAAEYQLRPMGILVAPRLLRQAQ